MHPITRRTALTATATAASAVTLAACGGGDDDDVPDAAGAPSDNLNLEGMPVVDEQITLTMMTRRSPSTAENWDQVAAVKEMEERSNIHAEWGFIPWDGHEEKRNLALASGDYPEIFHRTGMGAVDIAKYGEQGVLIPLNDLIDEYMPNLRKLLDDNPEVEKGMTFPDGNMYSFPTLTDPDFDSMRMSNLLWIRQDWLDQFGLDAPETLEELTAYLTEVKSGDPNGNGKADEIPLTAESIGAIMNMLHPAFGIATRGNASGPVDEDESGNLRFWRTSDGYREELEYLHGLYADGLIQEDIFSSDTPKFRNLGKGDVIGAVASLNPSTYFGREVGENYVTLPPLKKDAAGDVPVWTNVSPTLQSIGHFLITDKAEHPIEACRWLDYYYGDEGTLLFHLGVEGESYEEVDGEYRFVEDITNNPDGLTLGEAVAPYVTYGGGSYPGIRKQEFFKGAESEPQQLDGVEAVADHRIEEVWAAFTYTAEEGDEMSPLIADITKLIEESEAAFIIGSMDLSEWDTYVSQFDQVGLERYMEIQQAAYDRYTG